MKSNITGDRAHLLQVASAVRDAASPHIARMITRLVEEADKEGSRQRVNAARAVVSFAIEGARLAHEIESGESPGNGGTSVTVMIAAPNSEPRLASSTEQRSVIEALSESVRIEQAVKRS